MKKPRITTRGGGDFHDSVLVKAELEGTERKFKVVLWVPDLRTRCEGTVWQITFMGVLRIEMESGGFEGACHPGQDVYDVVHLRNSDEERRWRHRLKELERPDRVVRGVQHVLLASIDWPGLPDRSEPLEGIHVICCGHKVSSPTIPFTLGDYVNTAIPGA